MQNTYVPTQNSQTGANVVCRKQYANFGKVKAEEFLIFATAIWIQSK